MVNHKPVTVPVDADAAIADSTPENSQPISRLLSVRYSPSIEQEISINRTPEDGFVSQTAQKKLKPIATVPGPPSIPACTWRRCRRAFPPMWWSS